MIGSARSRRLRSAPTRALAVSSVCLALAACSVLGGDREEGGDDTGTGEEGAVAADLSVTIPPSRLTPFCQAMIDLGDELENDPPADEGARIIEVYESVVDEVPPEIRDDFLSVLARLQGGSPVATTAATSVPATTAAGAGTVPGTTFVDADEGYFPDEDPAVRLNAYISASCRSTLNNPGPLATQPGVTVADE